MPSKLTERKRMLPYPIRGRETYEYDGTIYQDVNGESRDFDGRQITASEGHQVSLLGKTDEDIGGDFETFKSEVVYLSHPDWYVNGDGTPYSSYKYWGDVIPRYATPLKRETLELRSDSELQALGTTAISRCSPVDSHSEVLTSIAETLKDGLPAIPGIPTWRERTAIARGAGSEYLNAQFGWIPLISDIRKAVESARNSAKLLKQFERDAGRNVRRRYEFPKETQKSFETVYDGPYASHYLGNAVGGFHPYYFVRTDESGVYTRAREIKTKVWFSGAFTYHMPSNSTKVGKFMSAIQEWDLLFGVAPTPELIWNLTPWSWATDWFANTGDVLANLSNAMLYGQVLRYGYVMEETTIIDRHVVNAHYFKGGNHVEAVVKTKVKRRLQANPFGFGITYDGLDAYQLSILAALGMTRR